MKAILGSRASILNHFVVDDTRASDSEKRAQERAGATSGACAAAWSLTFKFGTPMQCAPAARGRAIEPPAAGDSDSPSAPAAAATPQ
jgi:hypothetical protein